MSLLRPPPKPDAEDRCLSLELRLTELEARQRHAVSLVDAALFRGRAASWQDLVDALLEVRHTLAPKGGQSP